MQPPSPLILMLPSLRLQSKLELARGQSKPLVIIINAVIWMNEIFILIIIIFIAMYNLLCILHLHWFSCFRVWGFSRSWPEQKGEKTMGISRLVKSFVCSWSVLSERCYVGVIPCLVSIYTFMVKNCWGSILQSFRVCLLRVFRWIVPFIFLTSLLWFAVQFLCIIFSRYDNFWTR